MVEKLTYTVPEAAEALNLSADKVLDMIAEGVLPVVPYTGRRRLVSRKRLEEFVNGESHQ